MALLELANELLLSIAEALGSETDINAFAQLNRRCFQLLNPYLYRHNVQQNRSLALFWAAKRGELNTVVRLLDQGANIHSSARQRKLGVVTPLHVASRHGHHRIASILILNGANTQLQACDGHTPLGLAIAARSAATVAILIKHGADIRKPFPAPWGGSTALHFASYTGAKSIVNLLLDNGAGIKALDLKKQTPLHWAVRSVVPESAMFPTVYRLSGSKRGKGIWKGSVGTVRLLLDHNANTEVEDDFGQSPRDYAKSSPDRILSMMFSRDATVALYRIDLHDLGLRERQRKMKEQEELKKQMNGKLTRVKPFNEIAMVEKGPPRENAPSTETTEPEIYSTEASLERQSSAGLEWAKMRERAENSGQRAAKEKIKAQYQCSHSSLAWVKHKGQSRLRVDCKECSRRCGKCSFQCLDCDAVLCEPCKNRSILRGAKNSDQ